MIWPNRDVPPNHVKYKFRHRHPCRCQCPLRQIWSVASYIDGDRFFIFICQTSNIAQLGGLLCCDIIAARLIDCMRAELELEHGCHANAIPASPPPPMSDSYVILS